MKKTLIKSITAFAITLSAGASTAGPLRDYGQNGFAHKVHSSVSQTVNRAKGMADTQQTNTSSDFGFDLPSKRSLDQINLPVTLQFSAVNPNWSWDVPNIDVVRANASGYAIEDAIRLNWGQDQESLLLGQSEEDGRYLIGTLFLIAAGYGVIVVGMIEGIYDTLCLDGRISPAECYEFYSGL